MKLTPKQRILITDTVNDVFYKLEARLLGRFFKGPRLYFSVVEETDPLHTLEGAYRYTYSMLYGPGHPPDEKVIKDLADIAHNYMEAERLKRLNRVIVDVLSSESRQEAATKVAENIDKSTSYVAMLSANETRIMQAHAERDGITKLAASIGIDDPIVCKLGVIDTKMCKACRKLWHRASNIAIPKVYRLSELRDGYNKSQNDPIPTHAPTHPNCRHVLSFLPPGYGFDKMGNIHFVGFGHDEHEHQSGLNKSESQVIEDLEKYHCEHDLPDYRT